MCRFSRSFKQTIIISGPEDSVGKELGSRIVWDEGTRMLRARCRHSGRIRTSVNSDVYAPVLPRLRVWPW
jgi:hypothetical protein